MLIFKIIKWPDLNIFTCSVYLFYNLPDCTVSQNLSLPIQSLLYRLWRIQIDRRVELFVHKSRFLGGHVDALIDLLSNYCNIKKCYCRKEIHKTILNDILNRSLNITIAPILLISVKFNKNFVISQFDNWESLL